MNGGVRWWAEHVRACKGVFMRGDGRFGRRFGRFEDEAEDGCQLLLAVAQIKGMRFEMEMLGSADDSSREQTSIW
mgnify:CR=1 FL=1